MDNGASLSTRISAGITTAVVLMGLAGCDVVTDAATRLAYDIKAGANRLGDQDGAVHSIRHQTPSASGQCTGAYTVQLDNTPTTHLLDKEAGPTLIIDLERRGGRAVVTDVR